MRVVYRPRKYEVELSLPVDVVPVEPLGKPPGDEYAARAIALNWAFRTALRAGCVGVRFKTRDSGAAYEVYVECPAFSRERYIRHLARLASA